MSPIAGLIPYDLNAPLWTDGAAKLRWLAVPNDGSHDTAGEKIGFSADGEWSFPIGSVLVKQFDLPVDDTNPSILRRLETRFIVHGSDGNYYGVTYRWRPDGSDADLLANGQDETITIATAGGGSRSQVWSYPSRADCMNCHNTNAGSVLGARTHQLNRDLTYPSTGTADNQLRALNNIGIFSPAIDENQISTYLKSVHVDDTGASLEDRARSYLAGNCAHCHRPGGTNAYFDARFETPLSQQNLLNGPLLYTNGIAGAHVVTPDSVPQSMAHVRLGSLGPEKMPPVGKNIVDTEALAVIGQWIDSLDPNGGGGGQNAAPVAVDDSGSTPFETAITIDVLANDADTDGDPLIVASVGQGADGSVTINGDNTITYTPDSGFSGNDYFGYTARDPAGALSNTGTVSIVVSADGADTAISFTNESDSLLPTSVRSGVAMAIADMNADGLDDIVRFHTARSLKVEFQRADGAEMDHHDHGTVSSRTQWGICVADLDQDGYNDIISGGYYDGLKRYMNNGDGTWQRNTLGGPTLFLQAVNFADIDMDGDLDVFACHDDDESHKYRNDGTGSLTYDPTMMDATSINPSDDSGNYGTVWTDYDNDGDLDMYLSKCRGGVSSPTDPRRINMLFQNDGNGNYSKVAAAAGLADGSQSWATDFADIDHDGDMDCFIGNHYAPSRLMRNNGDGTFTDISAGSGIAGFSWKVIQVVFRDFNNDTWDDLLLVGAQHILYLNDGTTGQTFSAVANPFTSSWVESCAVGDLNHDGFVDVYAGYANLYNTPSSKYDKLFINDGNANGHVSVQLEGTTSNRNGIGARVELHGPWGVQVREVRAGESYGVQHSMSCHFGLGEHGAAAQLVVKWPSGTVDTIPNPPVGGYLKVVEGSSAPPVVTSPGSQWNWADDSVSLQVAASDPTGDDLLYTAANLPSGLTIDADTGLISGTLNNASAGSYTVQISASDAFTTTSVTFLWEVESVLKRYDGWATNSAGAGASPNDNIDGDMLNDALEFALGGDPADGSTFGTGLRIDDSGSDIDVLYVRPAGLVGVTYTLEASDDLQNWTDVGTPSVTPNGDDTETVRYPGAQNLAPLTADRGFVRLRAELASPAATAHTIPLGWLRTTLDSGYRTHGVSLSNPAVFIGRISAIDGATITFPYGSPAASMLAGTPHYLEVAGGNHSGHRYEIATTGNAGAQVTLDLSSPHNTQPNLPGTLINAPVVIRAHRTIGDCYPDELFQGSGDPAASDQLQFYNGNGYNTYFLLNAGPYRQWTGIADGTAADAGLTVIPPGTGLFVNNRGGAIDLLQIGEVRYHDFVQPLAEGFALVAEGYPIAASPATRGALLSDGFFGSSDQAAADQIQAWQKDSDPGLNGYLSYFLLDAGAGTGYQRWIQSGDGGITNQNNTEIFQPDRATFFKINKLGGHPSYTVPVPWTP